MFSEVDHAINPAVGGYYFIVSSPVISCGGNDRPDGKKWQPTAGFMALLFHIICTLASASGPNAG